ncbi:MAG: ribulose-phosphate 3-epimerase [Clostridiales bacterium]|jgi:ribulose-phosphate 3-epimerase|nr:ribulose-phosphate 3-epimerase [Clostridiales bacterium]
MSIKIAPSILSADFADMGGAVRELEACGADAVHCDVMDGVFVPNLTFGMPMIKAVKKHTRLPLDVHLMIVSPERYIDAFIDAGADYLTFHTAATDKTEEILKKIKERKVIAGIAVNPDVPLSAVEKYIEKADMLLIMSVYAGFGGQKFIAESLQKVESAIRLRERLNPELIIEIDGGINLENIREVESFGVDIAVAGNCVFSAPDKKERIRLLQGKRKSEKNKG